MQSSAKAAKRIERKQHALPVSIPPLVCAFVRQNRQLHAPQARRRLKVPTEIGSVSSLQKNVIEATATESLVIQKDRYLKNFNLTISKFSALQNGAMPNQREKAFKQN